MPLAEERPPTVVTFDRSLAAELLFVMKQLVTGRPAPVVGLEYPPALAERVTLFWADEMPFWELLVLAHAGGVLTGARSADELVAGIERGCATTPLDPALRSEPTGDQAAIRARLRRLHDDPALRRRYLRLVGDVAALVEADWTARRADALDRTIERCRAAEAAHRSWQSLVKQVETAPDIVAAGWERARAEGSATVAICAYGGSLLIDLPGVQFFALTAAEREAGDRNRRDELARRIRALADPTRLALVELLAAEPRGVTALAASLAVAQPTVSNHVKVLREAGLVRAGEGAGDRRRLTVDEDSLRRLCAEVGELAGLSPARS